MIYVLIPARDEASTVGLLLWKVRQAFTGFSREYQIIVVNDGSRDASEEVLAPYTRALPLTLLTHRESKGYARSLEELLRAAVQRTDRPRRDLAVTLQADFSDSPEDLVELVKRLEAGADIAVPDRRESTFSTRTGRLAHRATSALLRRRLGLAGVKDLIGTMRAWRLAVIERLIRQYGSAPFVSGDRWSADIGLLARAARHARTIESVPLSGERSLGARPSRARPVVAAWSAIRSAGALARELASPVVPAAQPAEPATAGAREEPGTERAARPQGQQRDRDRQNRRQRPRNEQRAEKQASQRNDQQKPAREEAEAGQPATDAAAPADGTTPKRKRRRRGRGRGRREGGNGQGDTSVSSPSAA